MSKLITVEELKADNQKLVERISKLSRKGLENKFWKTLTKSVNVETRLELVLSKIGSNLSYPNHDLEVYEQDVKDCLKIEKYKFCDSMSDMTDEEVVKYVREMANKLDN